MKSNKAIRKAMEDRGITVTTLANRLDMTTSRVCGRIDHKNISIDKLLEVLRVMDYKILIVPQETRNPNGAIEIDSKEETE